MLGNNIVRPRGGDGIKRTIVRRGDKFYAYEVRCYNNERSGTEQAFDFSKSEDRRHRTPDKHTMIGRSLIRFMALILKCELCAEIRESGRREMSMGQALGCLNTINCLSYGSSSALSEISKNCRGIFGLFGIDVPKEPISDVEVCDLGRLAIPKN